MPPVDTFFRELDANIVLFFGVTNATASMLRSAKDSGKQTVVFLTSDRNIADAKRNGHHDRGAYGEIGDYCRYALSQADCVVTQTPFQMRELKLCIGINSVILPNPIDLAPVQFSASEKLEPFEALWVGRADTFSKRADLCIELARRCPKMRFKMVMNRCGDGMFEQLQEMAPKNVSIVDRVPFADIEQYFQQASLLVNTSAAEGFPNSFLQAGKYGKPIVALRVDPADMLTKHGCGVCCAGDLDRLASTIGNLCRSNADYSRMSSRISRYVVVNHDAKLRCAQLGDLLNNLCERQSVDAA